ncbi:MAG: ATP-binding protein [Myxococcota bacterium]|nr:ATP-binding protein [Myxococcota bacterium]
METPTGEEAEDRGALPPTELALRASLSLLPVGVLTLSTLGTVLLAEGGVFPRMGLIAASLIGSQVKDGPLPRWFQDAAQRAISGEEISVRGEGGEGRTFEASLRPVRDRGGELTWVVASVQELSPVAHRAGERREARLRKEFEELADLTCGLLWEATVSPLRFTHVNREAVRLLGFKEEDWYQPGFWEGRIHPDDRKEAVRACAEAVSKRRPHELEYRMVAADGRVIWVRDFVAAAVEREHRTRLRGVMVDITPLKGLLEEARLARRSAERSARRASFLSQASRKLAGSLDFTTTMQTISQVAIPRFTDACALFLLEGGNLKQVVAAHRDPSIKRTMDQLFGRYPPDPTARVGMGHVARSGESFLFEEVPDSLLRRLARTPEHLQLLRSLKMKSYLAVPLEAHGSVLGVLACATVRRRRFDASDLRTAEELGRRSAAALEHARLFRQARKAVQLREDFLTIAAHELRTPLTPLKILLGSLESRLTQGGPPPLSLVRRAQRSVGRLTALVNDLLDVTQLVEGRLELHPEPISLGELLGELVEDYQVGDPTHRFETEGLAQSLNIRADPGRIVQVVANLLDNAIKYSPEGSRVRVSLWPQGQEAVFSVSDQGIGIPPGQQVEIFGRFSKATTAPITRYGGLGLGLYICKTVVERHGGRIWVDSVEGQGATFSVSLPLADGAVDQGLGP